MAGNFTKKILLWYTENKRSLPWLETNDAYKIWLSEIILQQTQVQQGTPYYLQFIKKYPTVFKLAAAPADEVMKLWEGLGYYSRARNLHFAAKTIVEKYNGVFPNTYNELISLKGIGNYTASAILSYAFSKPYAAVDSNMIRIITRYFGMYDDINSAEGKLKIESRAQQLLDKNQPGIFNQAMMDFGSLICKPKNPNCLICPVNKACVAFANDAVALFPVKAPKKIKRVRYFNYLICLSKKDILITQRNENDIWKNLYQFPLIESTQNFTNAQFKKQNLLKEYFNKNLIDFDVSIIFTQQLTHQTIKTRFYILQMDNLNDAAIPEAIKIPLHQLKKYTFPGVIREFLQRNSYF